ncbi:hypothetical protein [Fischerella sp. PCC 9605]|nr:hypothetical protein [Fischerella sp. PCC 9605]
MRSRSPLGTTGSASHPFCIGGVMFGFWNEDCTQEVVHQHPNDNSRFV